MTNRGGSSDRPRFVGGSSGARPTGEKAKDRRGTLRRLSDYLKPYHARLLLVAVLVVAGTMFGLAGPALLGLAIDQYVELGDLDGLMQIVLLMLVVYIAQGIVTGVHGIMMIRVGQHFVADIRAALFHHFQALSMDYHDKHRVGDLMSRISNDSETINQILSNGLIQFTTNILSLGGIMVAMPLAQFAACHRHADHSADHAHHHRANHRTHACCLPRHAEESRNTQRGHGREYHRHPRCPGLRARRRCYRAISDGQRRLSQSWHSCRFHHRGPGPDVHYHEHTHSGGDIPAWRLAGLARRGLGGRYRDLRGVYS